MIRILISQSLDEARIGCSGPGRAGERVRVWNHEDFRTLAHLLFVIVLHCFFPPQKPSAGSTESSQELTLQQVLTRGMGEQERGRPDRLHIIPMMLDTSYPPPPVTILSSLWSSVSHFWKLNLSPHFQVVRLWSGLDLALKAEAV